MRYGGCAAMASHLFPKNNVKNPVPPAQAFPHGIRCRLFDGDIAKKYSAGRFFLL